MYKEGKTNVFLKNNIKELISDFRPNDDVN